MEDDITASVVVPAQRGLAPRFRRPRPIATNSSQNCEPASSSGPTTRSTAGYDQQTEADIARPAISSRTTSRSPATTPARWWRTPSVYTAYTEPMRQLIQDVAAERPRRVISFRPRYPRIVDGKPSKNPRYLQMRPDLANPRGSLLAEMGTACERRIAADEPRLYAGQHRAARPPQQPARRQASARWRYSTPSTTWNCPSCSWSSSAA